MEVYDKLSQKLLNCFNFLHTSWNNPTANSVLLNVTCMEFLEISEILHRYYRENYRGFTVQFKDITDEIFLSLKQIITSFKYLERAVKIKGADGVIIRDTCQLFYERLGGCLGRMVYSIQIFFYKPFYYKQLDEYAFFSLMKRLFNEYLCEISNANDAAFDLCILMRPVITLILSKASSFVSVALKDDQLVLNALCKKVLLEYTSYESEIEKNSDNNTPIVPANYTAKFVSLKKALNELEDVLYEAYLRLVYTCLLDFEKLSIGHIHTVIHQFDLDESALKVVMTDFNLNIKRTMQIGILAGDLTHTTKNKIEIFSCLASIESLESYLTLPALKNQCNPSLHGELLEQHFNDEIANFKNTVLAGINSRAFTEIYLEILKNGITKIEKEFNYIYMHDLVHMANTLKEYFLLKDNISELSDSTACRLYYDFAEIQSECQAKLLCIDKVDEEHIELLHRMHFILSNLLISLQTQYLPKLKKQERSYTQQMPTATSCSQCLFELIDIYPCDREYFYDKLSVMKIREKLNDSDNCTCSDLNTDNAQKVINEKKTESIRNTLFQRFQSKEVKQKLHDPCLNNPTILEINKLLDDLMDESNSKENKKALEKFDNIWNESGWNSSSQANKKFKQNEENL